MGRPRPPARICGRAGVGVEPLAVRVIGEFRRSLLGEARDLRPLLRRQRLPLRRVVVLVRGIDEDQPHHLIRVGGGIEAGDQAAEGMAGQHVRTGNRGRGQQRVQVSDDVARGARHGHGITAAAVIEVEDRARAVVGADAGEGGHSRQHRGLRRSGGETGSVPVVGVVAGAGLEDHGGTALTAAHQIQLRPPPISTSPAKSPLAAIGDAPAGVED